MKKLLLAFGVLFLACVAHPFVVSAAPFPVGVGGLGTSTEPKAGQVPIGTNVGTYGPAYILCTNDCSIATSSQGISVNVPFPSATTTVNGLQSPLFYIVGQSGQLNVSTSGTSTINIAFATTSISQFSNDKNYLTGNQNVTVTGVVTGSGTTTITTSFASNNVSQFVNDVNYATSGQILASSTWLKAVNNLSDLLSTSSARTSIGFSGTAGQITIGANGSIGFATTSISQFVNDKGYLTSAPATSTINGVTGPTFTFSVLSTSSPSSFTTSSAQVFLNLLQYTSSSDVTVTATGTIVFTSHNISQFTNNIGYITTSTNNFGGLTNASITTNSPITWSSTSTIGCPTCVATTTGNWQGTLQGKNPSDFLTSSTNYGTSNVSTSTANTWSQPQTFSGLIGNNTSSFNGDTYLGASSTIYASPNGWTLVGDVGTYLNNLCNTYAPNATSSVNIRLPAMAPASSSWQIKAVLTQRCNFNGVGPGTHLTWGGAQGTIAIQESILSYPQNIGGGFSHMWISNGGSATTTNPTIGMLLGGTGLNGGAHTVNEYLTLGGVSGGSGGFGTALVIASNTYDIWFNNNLLTANGQNINGQCDLYTNCGEGMRFVDDWIVDPTNQGSINCAILTGMESVIWQGTHNDNCQVVVGNTTTGADLSFAVSGGDFENNSTPDYPAYPAFLIASNTVTNFSMSGFGFFNVAASSTTSTPISDITSGAGNTSINGVFAAKSATASTTAEFLNLQAGTAQICGLTGNAGTGNAFVNIVNGSNIISGCGTYFSPGVPSTIGFLSFNVSSTGSAIIRADANGGSAETVYGDNGSTKWVIGNDGANSDAFKIQSVSGNFGSTTSTVLTVTRTTGEFAFSQGSSLWGAASNPICIEGYDSVNSSTKEYIYTASGALTATTTKPSFCQ
jgi:hypothetical protein